MKLVAPALIASLSIDGVEYARAEDGTFDVAEHHVPEAILHGAVPFNPDHPTGGVDPDAHIVLGPTGEYQDPVFLPVDDEGHDEGHGAPEGTDIADQADDASGDTSSGAGDTTPQSSQADDEPSAIADDVSAIAKALEGNPDFDAMSRDEMLDWLLGIGIDLPNNSSKDRARAAIDDAVAEYTATLVS